MSRYSRFKASFEQIKNRPATKTESIVLCSLMLLAKAYDMNCIDLMQEKRICSKEYGAVFLRDVLYATEDKRQEFLWSIPKSRRGPAERCFEFDYLEKQIYYVSKTMRKGIGMDVAKRHLDRIKKSKVRREQSRKCKGDKDDATRKN